MESFDALPEDLVRLVLAHLPCPWVVQARLVCKQWHRILCCTHFALQWAATTHSSAPSASQSLCLLLPSALPSTLSALHLPTLLCIPLPLPTPLSSLLASSSVGLLLSSSPPSATSLSLFHPLSRLSLPLPPPRLMQTPLFATIGPSSPPTSTFHIFVLGVPDNAPSHASLVAEIYSSAASSWTPLPCLPALRNTTCIPRSTPSIVWWKESFCMLWGNRILTYKPRRRQDTNTRNEEEMSGWGRIELPKEPRIWDARFLTLHVIKDRLFAEGNLQEQGDFLRRYPLRIGVIEFDATKQTWKEVGCMPDLLSRSLCKQQHPAHSFYTAHSGERSGHIYFAPFIAQASSAGKSTEMTDRELVVFDVDSGCWSSIAKAPSDEALFCCPSFKGLTFQAS